MEEQVQDAATTDPLTGLANHRKLVDELDSEIKRFKRSGRPFAILLLHLDGLKKINEQLGYPAGSRALCRLADVLRAYCRSIDTVARYGGDEFAIVVPESGLLEVQRVALRICDCVAKDAERPQLAVSVGAAVFPHNGKTREELLGAADRALYEMKHRQTQPAKVLRAASGQ